MKTTEPLFLISVFLYVLICFGGISAYLEADPSIRQVQTSGSFFNPSIGETIGIEFQSPSDGLLSLTLLDRDGYIVRNLAIDKSINSGVNKIVWDGRNDEGNIVPDEAYSLKIEIRSGATSYSYFPAKKPLNEVKAELGYYDRQNRILSYKLPKAARVHVHAGSAVVDSKTQKPIGPVLKTLVNREPRIAGTIIEHWSGFDESGTIYVPELPNFVFSISASELAENCIISVGNRSITFLDTIKERTGTPVFRSSGSDHEHHRDLSTIDDISPVMKLVPLNGVWSEKEKAWVVQEGTLKLEWRLVGPSAATFSKLPGSLGVFINDRLVWNTTKPEAVFRVNVPIARMPDRIHYIAVNWGTEFGPLVVSAFRIKVRELKRS